MKATLLPLKGKYYGTNVLITDDKNHTSEIVIWHQGDHPPSSRELDGWNPSLETKKEFIAERFCDCHHETEFSLKIANLVVMAINDPSSVKL